MMPTIPEPDLTLFLGRLHPMLVHLPIGFLFLLASGFFGCICAVNYQLFPEIGFDPVPLSL